MAQPHQLYPPRALSPLQRAGSPQNPYSSSAPAAKRQRLDGQSPYGSPNLGNLHLPNQVFSSPYYGTQANGSHTGHNYSTNHNYNPAPPYNSNPTYNNMNTHAAPPAHSPSATAPNVASPNVMGPPGRPDNKPTDLNELGDVLFGAGVDLREEEAALLRSKDNNNQAQSFEDQLREASGTYANAKYPFSRDNSYSQNFPGDRGSFYGAGSFNQPPQLDQSADEIAEAERKRSLRKQAEIKQYHLNKPFLQTGSLQRRIHKDAHNMQVQIPGENAVLKPTQPRVAPQQIVVSGPDGHEVLKIVKGEPLLGLRNNLVDILTLISLATEERLRQLVEDAATLAKARRVGSHGLIPEDFVGLATRNDADRPVNGPLNASNNNVAHKENPIKRMIYPSSFDEYVFTSAGSYSEVNQPLTPISNNSSTHILPNPIAQALQNVTKAERAVEEERLAKRRKRIEAAEGSRAGSVALEASAPVTPGAHGEVAPDLGPKKSALKNQRKAGPASDAQAFAASNKTMNMALGLGGAMGKKLSWMKKDTGPTNPFLARPNTNAQKQTAVANGVGSSLPNNRRFGEFREDGEAGLGIQLRDMISVLEYDGKEKKALQTAYGKLDNRKGK
ncbi:MAG: hypothetical protein Q9217_002206 [Psora testacea]